MPKIHVEIQRPSVDEADCDHLTAGAFCAPCVAEAQQAATRAITESQMDPGLKLLANADDEAEGEEDSPTAAPEDVPATMRFAGPIGFENQMTGDGRYIASGALRADTPIPLRYTPVDNGGHDGAYVVGLIESMTTDTDGTVRGEGFIDTTTPQGMEVYRGMQTGTIGGISMDLDDMDYEVYARNELLAETPDAEAEPGDASVAPFEGYTKVAGGESDDVVFHINSARVRGATLVQIPAFADARISLTASIESDDMELLDGDTEEFGASGLPLTDRTAAWDAAAARKTLGDDPAAAAWAFFIKDGPSDQWGSYHLPFGRIEGGKKVAVWRGVTAAAAAVQGARGASGFGSAKPAIAAYYAAARKKYNDDSIQVPWDASSEAAAITAAAPVAPPKAWFEDPKFSEPTPLTFTTEGRVFGHIAVWGTCHTGFPGACVQPPRSNTNYAYFRTGILQTAEGTEVPVGHLTMETGHAGPNMSAAAAMAHYDNTGLTAADVAAGEDSFGIWVNGALRPDLTDEEIRDLKSAPMSGDWRRIGGNLELMAVLAVNLPGFPVLRTKALVASGATQSLFVPIDTEKDELSLQNDTLSPILSQIDTLKSELKRIRRHQLSQLMEKE